jgi:hypothetical protein
MGIGMPLSWASGCRFHGHRDAAFMGIRVPLSASCRQAEVEPEKRAIFQRRRVHGDALGILQQAEGRMHMPARHADAQRKPQESEAAWKRTAQ